MIPQIFRFQSNEVEGGLPVFIAEFDGAKLLILSVITRRSHYQKEFQY